METPDKRTEFLKNEQMGMDPDKQDNAGDDTFTPIYLNDNTTLETPEEKQREESTVKPRADKLETYNEDLTKTEFDKMNDDENPNA